MEIHKLLCLLNNLNHSFERKPKTFLLKSIIVSPKVSNENPTNSPSDPPISPNREENGYKGESSFTVRLVVEYPRSRPVLLLFSISLIVKSLKNPESS